MRKKEKPVLIRMTAMASYEGIQDDPIRFMTTGTMTQPGKEHYVIRYRESQQDEETGETVNSDIELDLQKNRVIMTRSGEFASTMVFARDQRFEGNYRTPYGDMNMAVYTRHLSCALGETGGSVSLRYQLNLQGAYASTNELHLEYRSEGGAGVQ